MFTLCISASFWDVKELARDLDAINRVIVKEPEGRVVAMLVGQHSDPHVRSAILALNRHHGSELGRAPSAFDHWGARTGIVPHRPGDYIFYHS